MGTQVKDKAEDTVKPQAITFAEVEHSWVRGGVKAEPNPFLESVKDLYEHYKQNHEKDDYKAKTLQFTAPDDKATIEKYKRQLRQAGKACGATTLIDVSNPQDGKVAIRFAAREKIARKNSGGGNAPTT